METFLNNDTTQTHYWQKLSLVENVDSAYKEKLLSMGPESAPAWHFKVSKSSALIGLSEVALSRVYCTLMDKCSNHGGL